jgi:hypothetical protein
VIEALPGKFVDGVFGLFGRKPTKKTKPPEVFMPYPSDCGDRGVNLGYRKPYVAEAFGGYFAGLLEDTYGYLRIDAQVDCPSTPETATLAPIARILYELRKPTGSRLVVIAAAGGMGKTTLTAKIVKCLVEQQDADFVLGDSAKTEHFDPATNQILKLDPTFSDARSFYRRLYSQIGLPPPAPNTSSKRMVSELNEQLRDFRAVIVVDNLDTVRESSKLLATLKPLLSRDIRAVVTTREIKDAGITSPIAMMVNLKPLSNIEDAKAFLHWHIEHYKRKRPKLDEVEKGLADKSHVEKLVKKTGGVPLIMQLVLNNIEVETWDYIEHIPSITLSSELLDYLYQQRWDELSSLDAIGKTAQRVVEFIAAQQMRGKQVTSADLNKWAQKEGVSDSLNSALDELDKRFLILNRDPEKGNFSVFPSLADFVQKEAQLS